mmetsp:Transcript_26805/g.57676  ORF Transcript_26805/g.57676 Transcript_26805/m.57676 type:complete len:247 (-) Transcript_26805:776-1516(-)
MTVHRPSVHVLVSLLTLMNAPSGMLIPICILSRALVLPVCGRTTVPGSINDTLLPPITIVFPSLSAMTIPTVRGKRRQALGFAIPLLIISSSRHCPAIDKFSVSRTASRVTAPDSYAARTSSRMTSKFFSRCRTAFQFLASSLHAEWETPLTNSPGSWRGSFSKPRRTARSPSFRTSSTGLCCLSMMFAAFTTPFVAMSFSIGDSDVAHSKVFNHAERHLLDIWEMAHSRPASVPQARAASHGSNS